MAVGVSTSLLTTFVALSLAFYCVECDRTATSFAISSTGKPLVKRPPGRAFKVVLFVEGGGLRGIIPAMSLIELERSIKRYLLNHPVYLPAGAAIVTVDDFDINLVDYIDCISAVSSGSWSGLYLASRGGQGASRMVLDDPEIVAKYGVIPTGGAEGLRVFYQEYGSIIYPWHTLNSAAGEPNDLTNPQSPGVESPLFTLDGLETTMEAFLGNTTLTDLETSVLIPAVDLVTLYTIFFVQNAFRDPPVTSSAALVGRVGPRAPPGEGRRFVPDLAFGEGKNYYLKDVGTAAGALPPTMPAKPVSQVGNGTMEYLMVDGIFPFEITSIPAAYFVSAESELFDLQKVAVLSVGGGSPTIDLSSFANAGRSAWNQDSRLPGLYAITGARSLASLMDYIYYSDPETLPYQYLRVNTEAPITTEEGLAMFNFDRPEFVNDLELIGRRVAEKHKSSIDAFVRDFIFG